MGVGRMGVKLAPGGRSEPSSSWKSRPADTGNYELAGRRKSAALTELDWCSYYPRDPASKEADRY